MDARHAGRALRAAPAARHGAHQRRRVRRRDQGAGGLPGNGEHPAHGRLPQKNERLGVKVIGFEERAQAHSRHAAVRNFVLRRQGGSVSIRSRSLNLCPALTGGAFLCAAHNMAEHFHRRRLIHDFGGRERSQASVA